MPTDFTRFGHAIAVAAALCDLHHSQAAATRDYLMQSTRSGLQG
jgi:hypothetical protein